MAVEGTAQASPPGGRIGKYEIVAKIGQGAMGEVWKARDTVLDRFVAIKTMSAAVLGDPDLGQRFLREAQSAARLNHPNVVTLHEFGEDAGRVFMAMELLDGEDLKDLLRRGGLKSLDDKLALMEQTLDGVAYAHDAGIVHRDLKPANIHVSANGRVKVMDFGLARLGESEMTRAGTVMGSPNYMSPEQVRGERAGPQADVFSLGTVFYEVLSGRRAFDAESMHAVLYKVTDSDPVPLLELCPDLPPILEVLIGKALAKDVELRYRDGAEMRAALEACRSVLDGSLDEETAIASLRQTSTIIQAGGARDTLVPRVDSAATGAPTLAGLAPTRPAASGRSGSLPVVRGATGSLPSVRRGSRIGSRPGSSGSGSAPAPRAESPSGGPARTGAPSRAPLFVAAAAIGALAIGAGVFYLSRRPPPPVAAPESRQAEALVGLALKAQLEVARRSLEFKDFEGAIDAARKSLDLDPGNAEAKDVMARARARLDEVEAAANAARQAARRGDVDAASEALARVIALVPNHPVAAELSAQLDSRFKARADAAERDMKAQAEAARREAQDLAARRTPPPASVAAASVPPASVAAPASAPPVVPPPAATAPSAPVAAVPAALAPPAAAPVSKPVQSDEAAVRQLLASLERAIEEKDLALYKRLRPGLPAEDERRLKDAFHNVASQQVDYAIESITFEGDKAVARVTRTGRVSGQSVPPVRQVLRLSRAEGAWIIVDIGQ